MWKFIANLLLAALAIGLTFFTASRTLDLLGQWLPVNQQIMQWLGLAAFEGGLYFWSFYFVTAAKGIYQRGIAGLMIVVCFVSVAVATVADLLLVGAEDGKLPSIPASEKQAIVVFVGVVIVLNVAAFLAVKLTHPDKLKEMAIQDAEDQISDMELRLIRKVAPSVAMQMAPIKAEQWVNDAWGRLLPGTGRPLEIEGSVQYQPDPTPPPTTPTPAGTAPQKKRGILPGIFGRKQDAPVFTTPPQPNQAEMQAWFRQMMDEERTRRDVESKQQPAPTSAPSYADDLAAPIPAQSVTGGTMAQPLEYCYSCGKHTNNGAWHQFRNDNRYYCRNCTPKPEPITENLAPFPVAPTEARKNGNGANHPKPMHQ